MFIIFIRENTFIQSTLQHKSEKNFPTFNATNYTFLSTKTQSKNLIRRFGYVIALSYTVYNDLFMWIDALCLAEISKNVYYNLNNFILINCIVEI